MPFIDTEVAHKFSSSHRSAIEASDQCGYFYCLETFPPSDIKEWIDEGSTALCPRCTIDSVLPDSRVPLTTEFLTEMQKRWF